MSKAIVMGACALLLAACSGAPGSNTVSGSVQEGETVNETIVRQNADGSFSVTNRQITAEQADAEVRLNQQLLTV